MGLSRKRLLLVKLESAYKTDASPSSGADAILCANLDGFQPMAGETVTRNIVRAYFGNGETYQATTYGTATFTVELAGTSGAPTSTNLPQYDALLKACGFTTAVTSSVWTATPSTPSSNSENNTSVTIAYHQDGLLHKLIGARGTVSFEFTNKQLPVMKFVLTGLLATTPYSEVTMPAPTYTGQKPFIVSTTNTTPFFGWGTQTGFESFTLDVANEIKHRQLVGVEDVVFIDRKPKGTLKVELTDAMTVTYLNAAKANTAGTFTITHGAGAGNVITLKSHSTANTTMDSPKYSSTDGIDMFEANITVTPVSGNDEFTLAIS